ncbi:MAG: hypothetical protein ACTSX6_00275 [Candidatus Heimdallarchaeaceae archaeon]
MGDIPATSNVTIWDDTQTYSAQVNSVGRLLVSEEPPPGTTPLRKYVSSQLGAVGTYDTDYVIPNGQTWHIDSFGGGSEAAAVLTLIWDPDGANEEIHRIFTDANNWQASICKDFVGDGVKKLRIRRENKVANEYVVAYFVGYY